MLFKPASLFHLQKQEIKDVKEEQEKVQKEQENVLEKVQDPKAIKRDTSEKKWRKCFSVYCEIVTGRKNDD